MQANYEDRGNTKGSEMSEFNVMEFVETEYKSDHSGGSSPKRKSRRKSQRVVKVPLLYQDYYQDVEEVLPLSPKGSKRPMQRLRGRSELVQEEDADSTRLYPYSSLMKGLSNQVESPASTEEPKTEKIFHKLNAANLCYPYASYLQELHKIALEDQCSSFSSISSSGCDLDRGQVSKEMKNFHFKTSSLMDNVDNPEDAEENDHETPYTTCLLNVIREHKLKDQRGISSESIRGVGSILKECMVEPPLDVPVKELQSSALLQKLSRLAAKETPPDVPAKKLQSSTLLKKLSQLAARENSIKDDEREFGHTDYLEEASLKSSHEEEEEEEEAEWRPSSSVRPEMDKEKRKSLRKKKSPSKFDASPSGYKLQRSRNKLGRNSKSRSLSLLQLILANGSNSVKSKETNKVSRQSSVTRSEVLEKIKNKIDGRKLFSAICNEDAWHKTPEKDGAQNLADIRSGGNVEKQSLLKEYLLKSSVGDTTPRDSPSLSMSRNDFSFSRLLQGFKAVSENHAPLESFSKHDVDNGGSILRKMLIESYKRSHVNSVDDDEVRDLKDFKPLELLDISSLQQFLAERDSSDMHSAHEIKQELESEDEGLESNPVSVSLVSPQEITESSAGIRVKQEPESDDATFSNTNLLREMLLQSRLTAESSVSNDCGTRDSRDTSSIEDFQISNGNTNCSSETDSSDINPICNIKCEVTCEDEFFGEVTCKREVVDESHECKTCHLPFSSSVDLANHEVLFHAGEETSVQTPDASYILPHSADMIQTGLFQEKLPA